MEEIDLSVPCNELNNATDDSIDIINNNANISSEIVLPDDENDTIPDRDEVPNDNNVTQIGSINDSDIDVKADNLASASKTTTSIDSNRPSSIAPVGTCKYVGYEKRTVSELHKSKEVEFYRLQFTLNGDVYSLVDRYSKLLHESHLLRKCAGYLVAPDFPAKNFFFNMKLEKNINKRGEEIAFYFQRVLCTPYLAACLPFAFSLKSDDNNNDSNNNAVVNKRIIDYLFSFASIEKTLSQTFFDLMVVPISQQQQQLEEENGNEATLQQAPHDQQQQHQQQQHHHSSLKNYVLCFPDPIYISYAFGACAFWGHGPSLQERFDGTRWFHLRPLYGSCTLTSSGMSTDMTSTSSNGDSNSASSGSGEAETTARRSNEERLRKRTNEHGFRNIGVLDNFNRILVVLSPIDERTIELQSLIGNRRYSDKSLCRVAVKVLSNVSASNSTTGIATTANSGTIGTTATGGVNGGAAAVDEELVSFGTDGKRYHHQIAYFGRELEFHVDALKKGFLREKSDGKRQWATIDCGDLIVAPHIDLLMTIGVYFACDWLMRDASEKGPLMAVNDDYQQNWN